MHLIITDAWLAKSRAVYLSGTKLAVMSVVAVFLLVASTVGVYHWTFLKGARQGWPFVDSLLKLVVKDELEQRDRFLRENLDVMAKRLGEMQVKLAQLEALGERVSGLAGISAGDVKSAIGSGGALVGSRSLTLQGLKSMLVDLDKIADQRTDIMTLMESRLFDQKIKKLMLPTQSPVIDGVLGSAFGWRVDPVNGQSALHTGLDFPAAQGTPILSAAAGIVIAQEYHPAYGYMVEIDHGNDLVTRYAHASKILVKKGELVKRGHKIAEVGSTGRSTGAHLHFEVLIQGVFQDPQKFLMANHKTPVKQTMAANVVNATSPDARLTQPKQPTQDR